MRGRCSTNFQRFFFFFNKPLLIFSVSGVRTHPSILSSVKLSERSVSPLCCRPSSGLMRLQTQAAQPSHNPFVPRVKAELRNRASTSKMVWADQPRGTSILAKLVRFWEHSPERPAPFKLSCSTATEKKKKLRDLQKTFWQSGPSTGQRLREELGLHLGFSSFAAANLDQSSLSGAGRQVCLMLETPNFQLGLEPAACSERYWIMSEIRRVLICWRSELSLSRDVTETAARRRSSRWWGHSVKSDALKMEIERFTTTNLNMLSWISITFTVK